MKRISNAGLLAGIGVVLVLMGFYVQSNVNSRNASRAVLGLPPEPSAAPWVWGGIGAVLILLAIVLWATGNGRTKDDEGAAPSGHGSAT